MKAKEKAKIFFDVCRLPLDLFGLFFNFFAFARCEQTLTLSSLLRLYLKESDNKDQRKKDTKTLRVNRPLNVLIICLVQKRKGKKKTFNKLQNFTK